MILRIENNLLDINHLNEALENRFSSFKIENLNDVKIFTRKVKNDVSLKSFSLLLDNEQEVLNFIANFIYKKSILSLSQNKGELP